LLLAVVSGSGLAFPQGGQAPSTPLSNEHFELVFGGVGVTSLSKTGDVFPTDYLRPGRPLGEVVLHYRAAGAERWSEAVTTTVNFTVEPQTGAFDRELVWEIRPRAGRSGRVQRSGVDRAEAGAAAEVRPRLEIELRQRFRLEGERLVWDLLVTNKSDVAVEIGDLGLSLDLRRGGGENVAAIYENGVVKHHFVSGHGSWIFWQRPNGVGPYLVMTPRDGTWLEYNERTDQVRNAAAWPWFYIHSGLNGSMETRGTWRQAHTTTTLAAAGSDESRLEHGFCFRWASDYRGIRDVIYDEGLVDVAVAPGMTVPVDDEVLVALRSRHAIAVEPEFPEDTEVEYLGERSPDTYLYRVGFRRLGENGLVVRWEDSGDRMPGGASDAESRADDSSRPASAGFTARTGRVSIAPVPDPLQAASVQALQANRPMVPGPTGAAWNGTPGPGRVATSATEGRRMLLEFFVTEPVEVLLQKRSRHIALQQQHRDSGRWYEGLFSVWDMRDGGVLRGPDNTDGFDGWWGYVLAADDPGLSKAPLVAAKNARWADAEEIAALDYYVEEYVWGGLQRTADEQPYPYGVYGVPNWFVNRNSPFGFDSGGMGLEHVFRMYDYPHIVMLYWHLYQIAGEHPELVSRSADEYLERAYRTARAYFEYPYEILPWYEVYKWGTMNEVVIFDLLRELELLGRGDDASWLRRQLERKAKYFVYDDPYPFRSEYSFDTTGFESSQALAAWLLTEHELTPDQNLWYDANRDRWLSHPDVSHEDVRELLERQLAANIALRGRLEPAFYFTGSDYRGGGQEGYTLSYMAQMGGWGILDYVVRFATDPDHVAWLECRGLLDGGALPESRLIRRRLDDPEAVPNCSQPGRPSDVAMARARTRRAELTRLASASFWGPFALMNTSPDGASGYWAPGAANDGASGWGFKSEKFGSMWIRKETDRGPWYYDGEIDLGYGAALRMLDLLEAYGPLELDDPVLGRITVGVGGSLTPVEREQ
jgi:hypothetical protein